MAKYKFVGSGAGVPGLPHEITDEEAAALGVSEILKAAIENGNYAEVKKETRPSTAATGTPPLRTKIQKESE